MEVATFCFCTRVNMDETGAEGEGEIYESRINLG